MPDYLVAIMVLYYLVAVVTVSFLLASVDRYEPLVVKYGMYRGITLEVIVRLFIAAFWLPYALFFWIRGLIRGD